MSDPFITGHRIRKAKELETKNAERQWVEEMIAEAMETTAREMAKLKSRIEKLEAKETK